MRIVTWNVWGRDGRGRERQAGIEEPLAAAAPDIVCLVESWSHPEATQPELVARRLGFSGSVFSGGWEQDDWVSGFGLVSRWPVTSHERRALRGGDGSSAGSVLSAVVAGDRAALHLSAGMLQYPLDGTPV